MKQAFYSVKFERKENKLCQSRPVASFFSWGAIQRVGRPVMPGGVEIRSSETALRAFSKNICMFLNFKTEFILGPETTLFYKV